VAYANTTLGNIPDKGGSSDPWGIARTTDAPKAAAKNPVSEGLKRKFDEPIPVTNGKPAYILKLPKAKLKSQEWQTAGEALLMEDRGPLINGDIGMKRALNAGKPVEFDPKRKSPHWGKCKFARDQ